MQIYIYKNGAEWGPYSIADLKKHLSGGIFSEKDFARSDQMTEWITAAELIARLPSVTPPVSLTSPVVSQHKFLDDDRRRVYTMGYFQRRLYQALGAFVLACGVMVVSKGQPVLVSVVAVAVLVTLVYLLYCFLRYQAEQVGWSLAVVVCILVCVLPVLLPFRLIMSAVKASKQYKRYGIATDWIGVTPKELECLK